MEIGITGDGDSFSLVYAGQLLLRHAPESPALVMARGAPAVRMYRGNFQIDDNPHDIVTPVHWRQEADNILVWLIDDREVARLTIAGHGFTVTLADPSYDRIWLAFHAEPGETVWGGGEQMSYFALNGRSFPIWTSEPGVGRDKTTALTRHMDETAMAGGDYWHTNFPQPTFLTSRWLAIHLDNSAYSVLDFTDPAAHRVEVWSPAARFEVFAAESPAALVGQLSERFGRPRALPDWAIGGAIVGLKDGQNSFARLEGFIAAGTRVAAIWCEDWAGIRETSFGRRLFWDWRYHRDRYPDLPASIAALAARGIRFLAYANPYLAIDGALYEEAVAGGHLCRTENDEPYVLDFGEFDCGVVDFTREATRAWFAERILGREMLDIGIAGWMADFGEYLPTDVRLADGSSAMAAHNLWPVLWAEVNDRALASRGRQGDALFFMRAGAAGVSRYCPLLWAGDQSVDFTRHDGIGTVITAALSAGLLGNVYSHSDCGGYTTVFGNVRSPELMMRWCELAAFAPVMRSHEGNRPDDNLQYDSTPELLACFARWSRVHAQLAPYVRHLCAEASATGLPVQRPLFLHYPDDIALYAVQDQFLYGADLLVAPVIVAGATSRQVIFPGQEGTVWRHAWTHREYGPGTQEVAAPLGEPPVFYRPKSAFAACFEALRR
jgi:alpha-glucosidase